MKLNRYFYLTIMICMAINLGACKNEDDNKKDNLPLVIIKKDKPKSKSDTTLSAAPVINLSDTSVPGFNAICVSDSALNGKILSSKLAVIYGQKISEIIKKYKLKNTGAPLVWYRTQRAPFFFTAAIPVDKKPGKMPKGMTYRKINNTKAIIAHFYGPYEETGQAYQVLKDWLKENKKKTTGSAYEVYVTDPIDKEGNPLDPYKVQTDIIFPHD